MKNFAKKFALAAQGQRIIPNASISVNFSVFCLLECADFDLARCSIQNLKLLQASEFILCPIFPFFKISFKRCLSRALLCRRHFAENFAKAFTLVAQGQRITPNGLHTPKKGEWLGVKLRAEGYRPQTEPLNLGSIWVFKFWKVVKMCRWIYRGPQLAQILGPRESCYLENRVNWGLI